MVRILSFSLATAYTPYRHMNHSLQQRRYDGHTFFWAVCPIVLDTTDESA